MSALILRNQTPYMAQFFAKKNEQVIAPLPSVAPHGELHVPSDVYSVIATTIFDDNTYSTAPVSMTVPMKFLAQMKSNVTRRTYECEMLVQPSPRADQAMFDKTTIGPVTFTISKNGIPLQGVVVRSSFKPETLTINGSYSVYAVINGVTTQIVQTTNPNAVISAVVDNTVLEGGYFTLTVG